MPSSPGSVVLARAHPLTKTQAMEPSRQTWSSYGPPYPLGRWSLMYTLCTRGRVGDTTISKLREKLRFETATKSVYDCWHSLLHRKHEQGNYSNTVSMQQKSRKRLHDKAPIQRLHDKALIQFFPSKFLGGELLYSYTTCAFHYSLRMYTWPPPW